jgi:hypothetical protein
MPLDPRQDGVLRTYDLEQLHAQIEKVFASSPRMNDP